MQQLQGLAQADLLRVKPGGEQFTNAKLRQQGQCLIRQIAQSLLAQPFGRRIDGRQLLRQLRFVAALQQLVLGVNDLGPIVTGLIAGNLGDLIKRGLCRMRGTRQDGECCQQSQLGFHVMPQSSCFIASSSSQRKKAVSSSSSQACNAASTFCVSSLLWLKKSAEFTCC